MAKELPKLDRSPLSDLFSTQEQRDDEQLERVNIIDINDIDNFAQHPYKVRDDAKMDELVDTISNNGVLIPCIVRPKENGRYEMVAGHRRKHAALRAGLSQVPCLIRKLTDDEATIFMVDSNSQREQILPSEKAFAYKMRLEAMKRQVGRPKNVSPLGTHLDNSLNSDPVGPNLLGIRSNEELSAKTGDSTTQIKRFIRLTELIPELLQMVDNSVEKPDNPEALQMAMRPAVEMSYLTSNNQKVVLEFMQSSMITPSHAQTIKLRKMQDNNSFTPKAVYDLLQQEKPNQKEKVSLSVDKFNRYFPPDTSAKDIEKGIFQALDFYMEAKSRGQVKQTEPKQNISI